MGLFRRKENRTVQAETEFEDALLAAVLGGGVVTRQMALEVPTVAGGIDLIANVVASTPLQLCREQDGKAETVKDDPRVKLLNDETGDTLNANEFWKAIVRDYYLGKGGYAYIRRTRGRFTGIYYVDEAQIAIQKGTDPIYKDFKICVNGASYQPFEFLKILRNTKDGASGTPIQEENAKLIATAYTMQLLELNLARRGGNHKGFLKAKNRMTDAAMDKLREGFSRLYSNENDERAIVLNEGIEFQETSATSVEMQMNENKVTNAGEFAKIFHIPAEVIAGRASETDTAALARLAAIPLMTTIQCALNRDFLLEKEKGEYYWAFDTKELLKGDMVSRFNAYKTALDANFMQIDEVRFAEDMEPLGLNWIKLGLQDVLYDPKTKILYTPNTNKIGKIGEAQQGQGLQDVQDRAMLEKRGNDRHDPENGQFARKLGGTDAPSQDEHDAEPPKGAEKPAEKAQAPSKEEAPKDEPEAPKQQKKSTKKADKTKYSPSPQRNEGGIKIGAKKYNILCGIMNTENPNAPEGVPLTINDAKYLYSVIPDGYGGMIVTEKWKIKSKRGKR